MNNFNFNNQIQIKIIQLGFCLAGLWQKGVGLGLGLGLGLGIGLGLGLTWIGGLVESLCQVSLV